ncbi:MAG: HAD family hydrolase [Anaerolineae bacterium]|jgi:putative hydrolase of the HAD superfamily
MGLVAVTFDFWGTLYQNAYYTEERLHLLGDALEQHGESRAWAELEAAYGSAWSVWLQVWRSEQRSIPVGRWVNELLGYLGVHLPDDGKQALGEAMETAYLHGERPSPIAGVTDVVPRLAERFPLGLISDTGLTPGRVLREVMGRDGLLSHFQVLTFSDELGVAKPQPKPFLHTLRLLGVGPEEAAHIGDLPETDLVGARGVGMKTVLFLGESGRADGLPLADAVFEDYAELPELLEALGRA